MDKNSLAFSRRVFTHFLVLMVPASALTWLAGPVTAQTGGLVAAYSFNEGTGTTVADASGNGNAGTLSGTTWTNGGKYGSALVFNGTSARVTINNSASLQLTAGMTLEAWVRPSTVNSAWRDVIYKGNDIYYLEGTSGNGSRPAMGGTFSASPLYGTAALAGNVWAHLAATYDGATMRLYVNGVQVASRAQTGNIASSTNPLQIGGDSLYGQYFQGAIDEVRVYNVALVAAQIQADMNAPIAPETQPPTAPGNLTATGVSQSQINLSWTASTDNVGVTGYLVERQSPGSASFAQVGTATATTYNDTGLTAGTNYSYRVRATDAAGNASPYSPVASATTLALDTQLPTVPVGVTATATSSSQINLSWTASTDNVGVTGYLVERSQGAGSTSFMQVATPTGTSYNDTGLSASTVYNYRVRATDAAGNLSGYSPTASATTSNAPASTGLVAAYSFNEGTGTTVADASGNVNAGTISGATWTSTGKFGSALVFDGTSARVTINNSASLQLTTGMTLEAWVNPSAVNSAWRDVIYKGDDNYYLEGTSASAGVPATGGTFGGTLYGTGALAANTWTHLAATYDGVAMRLYVNGVQVASKAQTGNIATSTNPLQIGGNSLYGQYFQGMIDELRIYSVALTAAQIQSDMNTPVGVVAPDTQPPTAPGSLTATAMSGNQINLSWTASTDNAGVTGYLVERQDPWSSSFAQAGTATGTTFNDTGLTAGTNYSYRVRATDAAGNVSSYSPVASATTLAPDTEPPTVPGSLTATAVSASQINLSWTAATDNVGVTGYRVERCTGPGCADFVKLAYPTGTTYSDTGLAPNTSYSYIVRATDAAGNLGPYSDVASATTPATPPSLVAAYSFNEGTGTTVADASGSGNAGTISGATWTTSGKYGKGLVFSGTSARVTINNSASLQLTTGMTLEAWVNPSTVSSAWRDVIYKGNDNYYLEGTSGNGGVPAMGGTFGGTLYGTAALAANTWSYLAATYDGATMRLYVNGVQVASRAQTGNMATSTNPLQIGGDSLYGQNFQGMIDEVRVYKVALTTAQIQSDMATPVGESPPTPAPDTQPPTAPGSLTATAVSGSQINLSWSGSTDNVGVTGYMVERCQGGGCTTFTQIGTATGTTYNDVGLTGNSTYSYRVRATDAAGNLSPYSNVAQATTGFSISPRAVALTFTRTQQFTASVGPVNWSVDGVAGGTASAGTITAGGVYTPPNSVGTHIVTATTPDQSQSANATVYVSGFSGKFTHNNDNFRTGQNPNETALTPANVNGTSFGKLFTYALDGVAHASPLYVANLNIPGQGFRNVVYVATEHNSVYAFDADGLSGTPLWKASFINPAAGITTVPANNTGECCDIMPEIGITSTPVIDPASGTLYVVAKTMEVVGPTTSYVQKLHALDITTGAEKFGAPVVIQASVPGVGNGSVGGQVPFDPLRENQRPALLLNNGVIYMAFGSHGDYNPWHGWVLGYNASTLQQTIAYCVTPNTYGGGVWQSGGGLAADPGGIYFVTGNGAFNANTGGRDYGDTFLKLTSSGVVFDYFTPHNQASLENLDIDLGAGGVLLLPDQPGPFPHLMLSAGKDATIYLLNRDNMGHYNANNNSQIPQSLVNIFPNGTPEPGNYSAPVYFGSQVYFSPIADTLMAFRLTTGLLSTAPTSRSPETYPYPGGAIAISANGGNGGILWAVQRNGASSPGVLRAYDPSNLATELYNSNQAGSRDTLDYAAKFAVPLVANGKVFVASVSQLTAYGLLP